MKEPSRTETMSVRREAREHVAVRLEGLPATAAPRVASLEAGSTLTRLPPAPVVAHTGQSTKTDHLNYWRSSSLGCCAGCLIREYVWRGRTYEGLLLDFAGPRSRLCVVSYSHYFGVITDNRLR